MVMFLGVQLSRTYLDDGVVPIDQVCPTLMVSQLIRMLLDGGGIPMDRSKWFMAQSVYARSFFWTIGRCGGLSSIRRLVLSILWFFGNLQASGAAVLEPLR